ncbi:MAG TPA: tyrosine-protein phosphatase [Actinokineospora sp.]|nr:tyrosine-protein phosphatase [Actinokineospora sp.]
MRRHIHFDRVHNFRDVGGYPTTDEREVRWSRLYRSDSLAKLEGDDWTRFLDLGVGTVIDLRYPWEIAARGRVPAAAGLAYYNLSVEHRPYDQAALGVEVEPGPYLAARFMEVAEDGVVELAAALRVLAGASGPAVIHCASGKDRTGLLAALVLALLGVDEKYVLADFALTELATARLVADWRENHPDRDLAWPGYGRAPVEVMRLFLAGIEQRYGSVAGYVRDQLGVGPEVVEALRGNLLAP